MRIRARIDNRGPVHQVEVATDGVTRTLQVPAKESGQGSGVNGGEATSSAPRADVERLIEHTDRVAEVHATLRQPTRITLAGVGVAAPGQGGSTPT